MFKTLSKETIDQVIENIRTIEIPWLPIDERIKLMSVALHSNSPLGQVYGISIVVRPNSEVKTEGSRNEHLPAHAELYIGAPTISENFVGEFVLTDTITRHKDHLWSNKYLDDPNDIIELPRSKNGVDTTIKIPMKLKKKIYEWANKTHPKYNISNWEYLLDQWNISNPEYQIYIRG